MRKLYRPKLNDDCLCGSGSKYKDCCWKRLPGFDIGKRYSAAIKEGKLEAALAACRADIVQYTVWHRTNTEPLMLRGGDELLKIDVNALAEYVERLMWLYARSNRMGLWSETLERLGSNIRHPNWMRKVIRIRAMSLLGPDSDLAEA